MSASRRDFFRLSLAEAFETLGRAVDVAMGEPDRGSPRPAPAERPVLLRPPGALPEEAFLATCTRCDACIIACPKFAVRRAGAELGPRLDGTPVIVPLEQPCWLCPDQPCIPVCEPGALRPLERTQDARLGRIRVREDACFAAQGSICETCAESCPTLPKAIEVGFGSAPELHPDRCAGCGVCAWLCPARAIDVLPPRGNAIALV